ncbi:hypothetical protein KUTeg_020600 [Tegillarca granosa]|uniref:Uncharacterized protein n=1 Tax=Tegillarca granosa TaxID=220873 RepID=A0ABQ9E8D1_TEGGR|nr:hypothetical protein KUTeg_020600 [Tegillarca granosa]
MVDGQQNKKRRGEDYITTYQTASPIQKNISETVVPSITTADKPEKTVTTLNLVFKIVPISEKEPLQTYSDVRSSGIANLLSCKILFYRMAYLLIVQIIKYVIIPKSIGINPLIDGAGGVRAVSVEVVTTCILISAILIVNVARIVFLFGAGYDNKSRSSKMFFPRPRSSYGSPRPPSAGNSSKASSQYSNISVSASSAKSEKILLKYTDGGIQRPHSPPLTKIVRRYIGRRTAPSHEMPIITNAVPAMYIDTHQVHNPLSIISQGAYNFSR